MRLARLSQLFVPLPRSPRLLTASLRKAGISLGRAQLPACSVHTTMSTDYRMQMNKSLPLQEVQNLAAARNHPPSHKLGSMLTRSSSTGVPYASDTQDALPVFDLAPFLALQGQAPGAELMQQCQQLADCLARTGCLVIRDPRVAASDNDKFLDLLESYFSRSDADKMAEARPHLAYQVGCTPAGIETPRCLIEPEVCQELIRHLPADSQPVLPTGPDVKWRYFWRVGPRPQQTQYAELNAEPVVPQGMPEWSSIMDSWGSKLLEAVQTVSTMAALGFELEADAFTKLMQQGPHLLAPTGSDLNIHGQKGTVLAGFHYDLNFITIHGVR
eukprot:GHUV01011729.1.p1 GENE.GHUV01011729.1~~GHUV01011729.1.p1  ORF type:complete len:329 (+),score=73.58 GHUV01011729.1:124-1110(+)